MTRITRYFVVAAMLITAGAVLASPAQAEAKAFVPKSVATANPLYKTKFGTVNCGAGSPRAGSRASYRAYLIKVNTCLATAWRKSFAQAGKKFRAPKMVVVNTRGNTSCGKFPARFVGYYCYNSETLYIYLWNTPVKNGYGLWGAELLAHEYGHHIQGLAGIRAYSLQVPGNETSRRLELQAQCFAGAFLRSVSGSLPGIAQNMDYEFDWYRKNGGDKAGAPPDHGSGPNNAYWLKRGWSTASPGSCNTWSATRSRVA
ncbi:neutral zinc metallopeptidase [Herbidospora yilanensis]|uniref:neutral zinc metallopeptidase n=1 Tax=Herbidospora yilanensis TaxID=354426 RepID=UPI0012FC9B3C|nr:neutral zinc metallopeptidase [Herbidospora yilanensis]